MAYGLNRVLGGEYGAHMILRNDAVLDLLRVMIKSERGTNASERHLTPRGIPFDEFRNKLGDQKIAVALASWLLRKSLVFRGLELECRDCGTQAWYSLNDVGNQFQCVGCQMQQSFDRMPHNASWRYRVNQLLASGLDQGVLPATLAAYDLDLLGSLRSRAYVFPNVILADKASGQHVAEIDLLGFENGEWIAAECKTSGSATESELVALRSILDCLGGGSLQLVRASAASDDCDELVDRVVVWDFEPIRKEPIDSEQLWDYLEPN